MRKDALLGSDGVNRTDASGLLLTKLHRALFEYINWVARIGPKKGDFHIGEAAIEQLCDYIRSQGWPGPSPIGDDVVEALDVRQTVTEKSQIRTSTG